MAGNRAPHCEKSELSEIRSVSECGAGEADRPAKLLIEHKADVLPLLSEETRDDTPQQPTAPRPGQTLILQPGHPLADFEWDSPDATTSLLADIEAQRQAERELTESWNEWYADMRAGKISEAEFVEKWTEARRRFDERFTKIV